MASGMGIGMSKKSKKIFKRTENDNYMKSLENWLKREGAKSLSPNENDWDVIQNGIYLLFDDDFFRY